MSENEFNPKCWRMDLILDYEVYDEDGSCVPYFTGRITDAEGRVICNAENEKLATELVGYVKSLHADYATLESHYNTLVEAVAWEREVETAWYSDSLPLTARALYELHENFTAARAEVSRLLESAP